MSVTKKSFLLIFLILIVDQVSKIFIKLNFGLGEHIDVFPWFQIYFIENNGMAFGMELIGKVYLTLFRIVAVIGLSYFVYLLIKKEARVGYILAVSTLLAGAAGNIFDSAFYGLIFSDSYYGLAASFLPETGGYAPLFHGKVVDMLYFPLIKNSAGEVLFFSPVFNIADSAITVSVFVILLFFRKDLNESLESKKDIDAKNTEQ
jgi:signal peptidase II